MLPQVIDPDNQWDVEVLSETPHDLFANLPEFIVDDIADTLILLVITLLVYFFLSLSLSLYFYLSFSLSLFLSLCFFTG